MQTDVNLPFITADASGPKHLLVTMTRSKLEQLTEKSACEFPVIGEWAPEQLLHASHRRLQK